MKSNRGKVCGYALIRTKDGIPRVRDMSALPDDMRQMIEGEIASGRYSMSDIENAQRELERRVT